MLVGTLCLFIYLWEHYRDFFCNIPLLWFSPKLALSTFLRISHKWSTLYEPPAAGVSSPRRWPSSENSQHSHCPCNPEGTSFFVFAIPDYESTDSSKLSEFQLSPPSPASSYTPQSSLICHQRCLWEWLAPQLKFSELRKWLFVLSLDFSSWKQIYTLVHWFLTLKLTSEKKLRFGVIKFLSSQQEKDYGYLLVSRTHLFT